MASSVKLFDSTDLTFDDLEPGTAAALLSLGGDIALVLDSDGVVRDMTVPTADSQLGATDEWVGRPWIDTVTIETRSKVDTMLREAASGGVSKRRQVNHALTSGIHLDLVWLKRRNHLMLFSHAANPLIRFYTHEILIT